MLPATVGLTALLVLSGCAALLDTDGPCPDQDLARTAYDAGQQHMAELGSAPVAFRVQGTVEGEVMDLTVSFDPEDKAYRVRSSTQEVRFHDGFASVNLEDEEFLMRNHDPAEGYDGFVEEFREENRGELLDDLVFSDHTAECGTMRDMDVIQFRYEADREINLLVVERDPPHRPLSGQVVDPSMQNDLRFSLKHERPSIEVETTYPKVSAAFGLRVDEYRQNERGGLHMRATFNAQSAWVDVAEIHLHLVDEGNMVHAQQALVVGRNEFGPGNLFEFDDRDGNGQISEGDTLLMDLEPERDVRLWDDWAGLYTELQV